MSEKEAWEKHARKLECLDCGTIKDLHCLAKPGKKTPTIKDVLCKKCIGKLK